MPFMQVQHAADLIRMDYTEMPDLQLTYWQAQRLWNLSPELCERALRVLTRHGFLVETPDGRFIRPSDLRMPAPARRLSQAV